MKLEIKYINEMKKETQPIKVAHRELSAECCGTTVSATTEVG